MIGDAKCDLHGEIVPGSSESGPQTLSRLRVNRRMNESSDTYPTAPGPVTEPYRDPGTRSPATCGLPIGALASTLPRLLHLHATDPGLT